MRNRLGGHPWPRTIPASLVDGSELLHIGGGETLPCPDAEHLPLTPEALESGLGTKRLALPPVRLHVLQDAVVHPGSRVVTTADGRIVAESLTAAMKGRVPLDWREMRNDPLRVDGTVAVFQGALRSTFHTLVADLPRAGLLIHPVASRLGQVRLLHSGPLSAVEAPLLAHLGSPWVHLCEVDAGRPIRAERVVIPGFATRTGVGAVPSWFRRWSDGVPLPTVEQAPRRVLVDDGSLSAHMPGAACVLELLLSRGIEHLDVRRIDPAVLFSVLRDAELVVGTSRDALAGCLFSRSAHVIELSATETVGPAIYYLAASKGLPYDVVTTLPPVARRETGVLDVAALNALLERRTG